MDTNTPTNTTTTFSSPSYIKIGQQQDMGFSQNPIFPIYEGALGYPENPHLAPHMQYSFPEAPCFVPCNYQTKHNSPYMNSFQLLDETRVQSMGLNAVQFGRPNWQAHGWSWSQEEHKARKSKIARDIRKQALQRSRTATSEAYAALMSHQRKEPLVQQDNVLTPNIHSYTFSTPDGKMLRTILTKRLKSCDVGSLGRIILPKRESEKNLPTLHNKDGILVLLKDVYSDQQWNVKFKYWNNNNSRMYILENTGEFGRYYQLQIGDSITLYEDSQQNLYVSVEKQSPEAGSSNTKGHQQQNTCNISYLHTPYMHQAKDEEEEASLALLIEELSHKEQEAANNLLSLRSGSTFSSI